MKPPKSKTYPRPKTNRKKNKLVTQVFNLTSVKHMLEIKNSS